MIGMLSVSASRASFNSPSQVNARDVVAPANTWTLGDGYTLSWRELAAGTFREFYMTESVLAFSDFVPGSRRGVRKSHRRIFDFKSHVWPSPGPTRTPDLGLSLGRLPRGRLLSGRFKIQGCPKRGVCPAQTSSHTVPAHHPGHLLPTSDSPRPDARGRGQPATPRRPAYTQPRRRRSPPLWRAPAFTYSANTSPAGVLHGGGQIDR